MISSDCAAFVGSPAPTYNLILHLTLNLTYPSLRGGVLLGNITSEQIGELQSVRGFEASDAGMGRGTKLPSTGRVSSRQLEGH